MSICYPRGESRPQKAQASIRRHTCGCHTVAIVYSILVFYNHLNKPRETWAINRSHTTQKWKAKVLLIGVCCPHESGAYYTWPWIYSTYVLCVCYMHSPITREICTCFIANWFNFSFIGLSVTLVSILNSMLFFYLLGEEYSTLLSIIWIFEYIFSLSRLFVERKKNSWYLMSSSTFTIAFA